MTTNATATAATDPYQKKFRYHHGNLRDALVAAALEILRTEGVEQLSLRALGKATGVTQAAPYSHFRDKDELLAAIAETGFQRLALQMAEDAAGVKTPRARVSKLVDSYIRFADENRPLFRLMFGRELSDLSRFPTLAMTAGKSYALISAALSARASKDVDTAFLTVAVWSLCHGLAGLVIDGRIDMTKFGTEGRQDFVEKTVAVFAGHLV
jgi:AcrR family transcriptional regulator